MNVAQLPDVALEDMAQTLKVIAHPVRLEILILRIAQRLM